MSYSPVLVSAIAQETLDRALEALPSNPDRRMFVAHSEPPAPLEACEQLTVHLIRMRAKLLQDSQQVQRRTNVVAWVASLAVVYFTCVPTLDEDGTDAPSEALDTAHKALLDAGAGITRHLSRLRATKEWPNAYDCSDLTWNPLEPVAPSGGHAAYRLSFDLQL